MPPQGRLAHEGASRPLLGENLHDEAVVTEIIARSGEFGAAWGEVDAVNSAVNFSDDLISPAVGSTKYTFPL